MIRVFIAEDHEFVREGLRRVLEAEGDITVVGEAADGRTALNALADADCDVLLLDLSLPRVQGPEVLHRLRASRPDLPVVILSMYPADQHGPLLRAAGAAAYVSKDQPAAELVSTLRAVVGQTTAGPAASSPAAAAPHAQLTAREHQVFLLVIQGHAVVDIAAELDVAACTVSNHLSKVREKLGAKSVVDLAHYAHRWGLL